MKTKNNKNKTKSIKILVVYHKKDKLFKNDILVPIHAGRAKAFEKSKDGQISKDDYNWLLKNMIGDDTGDNISHLNREFNEWTTIYWAWKNYDKLGNPDYIGLNHYRRFFSLPVLYSPLFGSYIEKKGYTQKNILKIMEQYDFIHTGINSSSPEYSFEPWQAGAKLSENNHPILYKEYKKYLKERNFYTLNMFIMKREDFFNLCEECFPVMFDFLKIDKNDFVKKNLEWNKKTHTEDEYNKLLKFMTKHNMWYPRTGAYMMEYIFSFYISYLKESKNGLWCKVKTQMHNSSLKFYLKKIALFVKFNSDI